METEYYCKHCDVYFRENRLPNMNKAHHCGKTASIIGKNGPGEVEKAG